MVGYMIEQELRQPAAFRGAVRHDPDHGRGRPGRPGVQGSHQVHRSGLRAGRRGPARRREGWASSRTARSGAGVPSPQPKRIFEIRPIKWLLEQGTIVICAAAAASRRCTRRTARGHWSARRWSSTRTAPAACSRASSPPICTSWRPTSTASTWTGVSRRSVLVRRTTPGRDGAPPVRGRQHGAEGRGRLRVRRQHGQRAAIGALADIERIGRRPGTIVEPGRGLTSPRTRSHLVREASDGWQRQCSTRVVGGPGPAGPLGLHGARRRERDRRRHLHAAGLAGGIRRPGRRLAAHRAGALVLRWSSRGWPDSSPRRAVRTPTPALATGFLRVPHRLGLLDRPLGECRRPGRRPDELPDGQRPSRRR